MNLIEKNYKSLPLRITYEEKESGFFLLNFSENFIKSMYEKHNQYHTKEDNFDLIPLRLNASLKRKIINLASLKKLSVGEVIDFNDDNIYLCSDKVSIYRGKIGVVNNTRAIKIGGEFS
ncbi:MAG: FliM/FliN family flagellar motor switch protein [Rickettsiaceae bacterium H1]|nr:FliM/FliN family flagellar motor switch protein [Rickettsiaceae bacterium H1]